MATPRVYHGTQPLNQGQMDRWNIVVTCGSSAGERYTQPVTVRSAIEQLRDVVSEAPADVNAIYLFGSVARGSDTSSSDIDLGVLLHGRSRATLESRLFAYGDDLQRVMGRPVQIVILNDAPVDLVHRVLRERVLLLERDRPARIRFEVHSRNAYFDLLPILTAYRRRVLARAVARP